MIDQISAVAVPAAKRNQHLALAGAGAGALIIAVAMIAASPAMAGIFKCVGPDGRTTYTSDPGTCANPKAHTLKGSGVQRVIDTRSRPKARSSRRSLALPAAAAGTTEDGTETMWRRKRGDTQRKLRVVDEKHKHVLDMIKGCNRGGEWFRKDAAGIRQHVPCEQVQAERKEIERELAALQAYLDGGLEDECRRQSCLPGWVR